MMKYRGEGFPGADLGRLCIWELPNMVVVAFVRHGDFGFRITNDPCEQGNGRTEKGLPRNPERTWPSM